LSVVSNVRFTFVFILKMFSPEIQKKNNNQIKLNYFYHFVIFHNLMCIRWRNFGGNTFGIFHLHCLRTILIYNYWNIFKRVWTV